MHPLKKVDIVYIFIRNKTRNAAKEKAHDYDTHKRGIPRTAWCKNKLPGLSGRAVCLFA